MDIAFINHQNLRYAEKFYIQYKKIFPQVVGELMFIPSIDDGIANQIMKDPYEFDFLTIKETTKSFQVLSGFSFPLHRFVPFKRMRRGRYADFPPLTFKL